MARLLLLTNALAPSAEVLPALGLLSHTVRILPAEATALVDSPDCDVVIVDARRELASARSLCRVLRTTGIGTPLLAVLTEGGLAGLTAEWGLDDVLLDTAGPAEVDARLRLAMTKGQDDDADLDLPITSGELVIDEATYSARFRGQPARPDLQGVRAAQVPRAAPGPRLHPRPAAPGGLGLRLLRRHPHRRRPRASPARQARARPRGAHRHGPQRRLPPRARPRRRPGAPSPPTPDPDATPTRIAARARAMARLAASSTAYRVGRVGVGHGSCRDAVERPRRVAASCAVEVVREGVDVEPAEVLVGARPGRPGSRRHRRRGSCSSRSGRWRSCRPARR